MNVQEKLAPGGVTVGGAPEGYDAKLVADLVRRADGPVIHVARDDARAAALSEALGLFAPTLPVLQFPAWDCLPYDRVSPQPEISAARMATLAALADGFDRPAVVVTTLAAAQQRVPARRTVAENSFTAQVDEQVDIDALTGWLGRMGFNRTSTVVEHGDYAVRGGIIDIYPPGADLPLRLDFFGDVLEGVRRFDAESQRTVEKVGRVELAPASEVILDDAAVTRFRTRYRETFGAPRPGDPLYEAVSAGRKAQGAEHWVALFHEKMETLFDYLPQAPVTLDHQVPEALAARVEMVRDHYEARRDAVERAGRGEHPFTPLPPQMLYLDVRVVRGAGPAAAPSVHAAPPAERPGRDRRRRAGRAVLRAGAPAGERAPVRRAGRAHP